MYNLFTCSSIYDGHWNFTYFKFNNNHHDVERIQHSVLADVPFSDYLGFRCYDRAPVLLNLLRENDFLCFPVYLFKVDNVTDLLFKESIKSHVVIGVLLDGKIELVNTNYEYFFSDRLNEKSIDGFSYDHAIYGILNRHFSSILKY